MVEPQNVIGRAVRLLRNAVSWNLGMAAAAARISPGKLSRIENGEECPDPATAERIGSAMGCSPAAWNLAVGLAYEVTPLPFGARKAISSRAKLRPARH